MKKLLLTTTLLTFLLSSYLHAQIPANAEDVAPLLIGETFPDLELEDTDGNKISLNAMAKAKPTIVIFYRGGWCPYCNRHLAEVGQSESEILQLGYQIAAISPDAADELAKTVDKNDINYKLLSDGDGALAKAVGIAFQAPERYGEPTFVVPPPVIKTRSNVILSPSFPSR